ncbi:hypothetical protein PAT3040_01753, partial [Paenibacillus agaridevorans]
MAVLHLDNAKQEYIPEKRQIDRDIIDYIKSSPVEGFDSMISGDTRWEVFYHLSSLRESLFNWYEFKEGARLLEVGAQFGALTGLFCRQCAHVTTVEPAEFRAKAIFDRHQRYANLDIYAGHVEEFMFDQQFDYVIVAGVPEYWNSTLPFRERLQKLLQHLADLLRSDGSLMLAVDNKFGLRYFCGASISEESSPFDAFQESANGKASYLFSKKELEEILQGAGFSSRKFYYPLPDYKLPQLIYSEEFLPQSELRERLVPYYLEPNILIANELDLYDDLVHNQVFEFFANSFLIECSPVADFCSVQFAAVTTDRGSKDSFATTIHSDNKVYKRPLHRDGQISLQHIYSNLMDIQAQGLAIVPHHLEHGSLQMPYVQAPTLSEFMGQILKQNTNLFIELFDELFNCILSSSIPVESGEPTCFDHIVTSSDWGIVLKKAYIDMIPFNCFYMDGKLVFFDQEFVRENCPAKYVIFRALKYTYLFHEHAEQTVPLHIMKEKYGLMTLWDIFDKEENQFVSANRNYNKFKQFYKWTKVDHNQITNNRKLLAGKYEGDQATVRKLKSVHKVQMELLRFFIEICDKYHLRYFAVHGTLLGAVRHQGFIPWDDDVDIAMPREDYNKLKQLAEKVFPETYELQTNENAPNVFYGNLSRLRDNNTTGIELSEWRRGNVGGIWIDIMALDYIHADSRHRERQLNRIHRYQRLLLMKTYGVDFQDYVDFSWRDKGAFRGLSYLLSRKWLLR